MALAIRILVHDSKSSHSVLGQLGRKAGTKFFDSAIPYEADSIADHWGLVVAAFGQNFPSFVAPLDGGLTRGRWTDFDSWWAGVVFRDAQRREITRGDLVLAVANQDGGAHVDPALREVYAALSRQNSLGWTRVVNGEQTPVDPPHLYAIRQVAHEVLKTLVPNYTKKAVRRPAAIFGGLQIEKVEKSPVQARAVGRNDPCYCGSGLKFKKCHGRAA